MSSSVELNQENIPRKEYLNYQDKRNKGYNIIYFGKD